MAVTLKLCTRFVRALVRSRTCHCFMLSLALVSLSTLRKLYAWRVHLPLTKKSIPKSAVFTPYHLTPGGGERVVFNMIAALQRLTDHSVDLLVADNNVCRNTRCARRVALTLDISGLDWLRIKVRAINHKRRGYLIWIQMANSLFPPESSRGHFAMYHCQFPFDGQQRLMDSDGGNPSSFYI